MRRIGMTLLLGASLALAGACKKDEGNGESEGSAPKTADPTEEKESAKDPEAEEKETFTADDVIPRFEECWSAFDAQDAEKMRSCYADSTDFRLLDNVPPMKAETPEAAMKIEQGFWTAFPDLKHETQLVMANGKKVAAVVLFSGTNEGKMMGMPATGEEISFFAGQLAEFDEEGKVVRDLHMSDQGTLMHQLGVHESKMGAPDAEEPWGETVKVVAEDSDVERENVETVEKLAEAMKNGDAKKVASHYAEDATFRYVPEDKTYEGREAVQKGVAEYFAMNEDLELTVDEIWGAGDWVVAHSHGKAKLAKGFPGARDAKGKTWESQYLEFFEIADGKVQRHWLFANGLKVAADVGLVDPAKLGGGGGGAEKKGAAKKKKGAQKKGGKKKGAAAKKGGEKKGAAAEKKPAKKKEEGGW